MIPCVFHSLNWLPFKTQIPEEHIVGISKDNKCSLFPALNSHIVKKAPVVLTVFVRLSFI